jgi:hypothetical protein
MRRFGILMAFFLSNLLLASGCARGPNTYPVSGRIAFNGEPIVSGEIILYPQGGGSPVAAPIKDGVFHLRAEAGPKRVEIRATREVPGKRTAMGPVSEQYIPERYNEQTTLRQEVAPGGPNRIELDLKP